MNTVTLDHKDVVVYDDEKTCRLLLKNLLYKAYGVESVELEDQILSLKMDLIVYRPKILILDYMYEGGINLIYALPTLRKFEGPCIIFSGTDKDQIRKDLLNEFGSIPENFYIVNKGNIPLLKRILDKYFKRKE
jgi:hypothetical protein